MEQFKPEQSNVEIPKELFKEKKLREVGFFLKINPEVKSEEFFKLAAACALDSEELFRTYHNLFQFQQQKSLMGIQQIRQNYKERLESSETEEWRKEGIANDLSIAEAFIEFIAEHGEHGWIYADNAARTLEDVLK